MAASQCRTTPRKAINKRTNAMHSILFSAEWAKIEYDVRLKHDAEHFNQHRVVNL